MKRTAAVLLTAATTLAGTLGLGGVAASSPASAAPYCGITWGSLPEADRTTSTATVQDIRSGRHTCYDRLVIDLAGKVKGYDVRYGTVAGPSGTPVSLRGTDLAIEVLAPAYDSAGKATYTPAKRSEAVAVDGYRTLRQVAWVASFEGQSTIGLGVRARLPFRVLVVDGPGSGSRLVVDVAHAW